jgi:hypothetical protein
MSHCMRPNPFIKMVILNYNKNKGMEKMKKDLTELVFILDRSGSMGGLEEDTINGYNSILDKQISEAGEAIISTVLFDSSIELLHDRLNIREALPLTDKDYYVRGSTALLDAIGVSISRTVNNTKLKKSEKPEKVIFVITTDGEENSSREYSFDKINKMISYQKEKYGWEFIFLGANIDAIATARRFGINEDRASNYHSDKEGTTLNYQVLNDAVSEFRSSKSIDKDWKKKIEEDYETRKK